MSSIIRGIALDTGVLDKKWCEDVDEIGLKDVRQITDPDSVLRISIGLAWESWYIPHILGPEGAIDHPGEMQVDGIFMTHDAESLDVIISPKNGHTPKIHEVKATYKSTKTVGDLSKSWMWLTQCKAYCKGRGTTKAQMHVLFICGDYKMPIKPQLKVWDVQFTQQEIDECWDLLTEYRDYKIKGRT